MSYKPSWQVTCKRLETSSKIYISFAVSDFHRPWSLSILSERLGLQLTAEVAPPDLKLWRPYKLWSTSIALRHSLKISLHLVYDNLSNISNTRNSVSSDIQTPRRELKIRRAAEYFSRNSRCLDSWWNTVSSVWYIFSIETRTKEKTEK